MGLTRFKSVGGFCMTYYLMYYVLAISQSEREIHVNILDQDAPRLSGKIDTQRTTI